MSTTYYRGPDGVDASFRLACAPVTHESSRVNALTGPAMVCLKTLVLVYSRLQAHTSPLSDPTRMMSAYCAAYRGYHGRTPPDHASDASYSVPLNEAVFILNLVASPHQKLPKGIFPVVAFARDSQTSIPGPLDTSATRNKMLREAVLAMASASLGADKARTLLGGTCCDINSPQFTDLCHEDCARAAYIGMRKLKAHTRWMAGLPCSWPSQLATGLVRERFTQQPVFATEEGESLDAHIVTQVSEGVRRAITAREEDLWWGAGIVPVMVEMNDSYVAYPVPAGNLGYGFVKSGVCAVLAVSKGAKRCVGIKMAKDASILYMARCDPRKSTRVNVVEESFDPGRVSLALLMEKMSTPGGIVWIMYDVYREDTL